MVKTACAPPNQRFASGYRTNMLVNPENNITLNTLKQCLIYTVQQFSHDIIYLWVFFHTVWDYIVLRTIYLPAIGQIDILRPLMDRYSVSPFIFVSKKAHNSSIIVYPNQAAVEGMCLAWSLISSYFVQLSRLVIFSLKYCPFIALLPLNVFSILKEPPS